MSLDRWQVVELYFTLAIAKTISDSLLVIDGEKQVSFYADDERPASSNTREAVFDAATVVGNIEQVHCPGNG